MNESYYDYLKDKIKNSSGDFSEFERCVSFLPDIFKLLSNFLEDDTIDHDDRVKINAALAYIVVPNDIIPEDVYGLWALIDDVYVGAYVLSLLKQNYHDTLVKLWNNDEDFDKAVDICMLESKKFLEEKNLIEKILEYAGLD
jgi:uncharacterized membrane protein YkvA (DUF1232 family)